MKILLIEDNDTIAKGLFYSFKQNKYEYEWANSYEKACDILDKKFDFIILDVMLPDGNGFNLYENKIKNLKIPTIFLTAKDDEDDIVKGLYLGADDYMTKPFSTKELFARINKILNKNKTNNIIRINDISFDTSKMEVLKNNCKVELTSLELKILNLLFENINKVVSRNIMLDKIWEWTGNDVDDHTITVYLKRIREKIGTNIITTVKGIGYRIDEK